MVAARERRPQEDVSAVGARVRGDRVVSVASVSGARPAEVRTRHPARCTPASRTPASHIEWIFAGTVFPLVVVGSVGGCIALLARGLNPFLALAISQAGAFLIVIVFERVFPYVPDWNRSHRDVLVDLAHGTTVAVTGGLLQPAINAAGAALGAWLAGAVGLGLWPHHWPLALQLALALLVGELFQYWVHRLEHEREILWRLHATHHSAPRLYWLNAGRFHFVDIWLNNVAAHLPLVALGAGVEIFVLWTLFSAVHGTFQHANLQLRLGPLNWIFSMAELHRWHHSRRIAESNTNYGQNLIVWDVVFGTRFLPKDREPPVDIGLADLPAFPMTYFAQLASPLRWRRIQRESRERLRPSAARASG